MKPNLKTAGNLFALIICCTFASSLIFAQTPEKTDSTDADIIEIHPIQHASFVMTWNGKTIHVDPVGDEKAYASFAKADLLLLTHDHGDHLNEKVINAVADEDTQIVAPATVFSKLNENNKLRTIVMTNSEQKVASGIPIEAIPMHNLTQERLRYHPKGNGNGYVATLGKKRVYIAGDTEDIPEMRALKNIDIAFIPMNLPYTMTVQQAAEAVKVFKPKVVIPYHYRGSDVEEFKRLVGNDSGIEVRLLAWYP
ncbi:MAG: MBL fold metallo-hydrolase [Candidatus Omnitrophota bacterium]|nr:MAG: MBL fold metallo-hydrolase [Candidatus Omnitrophota bacterium]